MIIIISICKTTRANCKQGLHMLYIIPLDTRKKITIEFVNVIKTENDKPKRFQWKYFSMQIILIL